MKRKGNFVIELSDGRRVRFSLKTRDGAPFYFVVFRDADGCRRERSTEETSQRGAEISAIRIIKKEFSPSADADSLTWDDAITSMTREMKAQNLRPTTVTDYLLMLDTLRRVIPSTTGPGDITPSLAQRFKNERMDAEKSPYTVRGNLIKLSAIWSKWLIGHCRLPLEENPWEQIEKPKVDDPEPRYIEQEESEAFFAWLNKRWDGWRLPVLAFEVIGLTGRRILQTCSLPASCLVDGRINFSSDINKSRKRECARLPEPIFKELEKIKGKTYLWERYSEQLNAIYRKRGQRKYARCQEFHPKRLKRWLQKEIVEYNTEKKDTPGFVPFTTHNFRDTAMTKAWDADIDLDRAAIAFGCNRETMKKHYIRKEALAVADAVFEKIHGKDGNEKPGPTVTEAPAPDSGKPEKGASSGSGEEHRALARVAN